MRLFRITRCGEGAVPVTWAIQRVAAHKAARLAVGAGHAQRRYAPRCAKLARTRVARWPDRSNRARLRLPQLLLEEKCRAYRADTPGGILQSVAPKWAPKTHGLGQCFAPPFPMLTAQSALEVRTHAGRVRPDCGNAPEQDPHV